MKSLLIEPALSGCPATSRALPQADAAAWLAILLTAYEEQDIPPSQMREVASRLAHTAFEDIITAIERARHTLTGDAEIRLYKDWITANVGPAPHLFAAWFNLGVAFVRAGDPNSAVIAYANARSLNPVFYPAAVNLGLTLENMGQTDAALRTWDSATQTGEARTALLNQKGRLLEVLGRLDEAETALCNSLLANSSQPDAMQHWLHIRQKMCLWPVLPSDILGLSQPELLRRSGPLGVLALTDDVNLQRQVTALWIERKMPPASTRLSSPEGYSHDRIRIGYLSSDFCRHAMSFLIAELLERHDRNQFEVFGYCSTLEDGSDIRQRVIAAFDHHRVIRDLSDEQAARVIRDDEIDILIDLNGLTARTRLAVMRWRPAPVQATYLGFIGPVALPELDYLLCDDFVIPPEHVAAYYPTPLAIAQSYQANDSKRLIGCPTSRQDVGLPADCFVFCCFSNHYKITEALFGAWMSILRNAHGAVLWLTADNAWSQANLRAAAKRAGVAPDRILFSERTSPELYMSRLGLADLFLDTFPYNAGTVASDAIRMQLPLLTLCGTSFAARMAGSLLNNISAHQGITTSLSEYIATATLLATNTEAYGRYKKLFIGDAWKNTVGDIARFTAEFEAALLRVMVTSNGRSATDEVTVSHRAKLVPESLGCTIASGIAIARNLESENCSLAEAAIDRAAVQDREIVDLIVLAEKMTGSGKIGSSLELYERWLQHHTTAPLRHVAYFNYGTLLNQIGHPMQAAAAFAEATRIKPEFLPAYINAGSALEGLGHVDRAVGQWLQVANQLVPVDDACISYKTTALKHLGRIYKSVGNVASAEEALRRCLGIDPNQRDAVQHWIALRQMQCKWPIISPWGRLTRSSLMAALSPLTLAILTDDPMHQLAHAWSCSKRDVICSASPHTVGYWLPSTTDTDFKRPLRIGYVSADLREHAIGFLTAELFELHDRTKVEVFIYYSGRPGFDAIQMRIRQAVDHWSDIADRSGKQIAQRIIKDEINILVDLGGHTGDAPTAAFALRPAPVIVNWLGYPGSMGTPHHQYIIADETIVPPSYEKYYSERVVRLPCYQPTDRRRTVAEPPSRLEVGLNDKALVYCCFNGTQKITPAMFQCWMAILARVPNAVLWLLSCDAATDERLRQQAIRHGISADRLIFAERKPNPVHLARYPLADMFLDTSPYGAHTTASDSLWMGVPVLTIAGHSFASRVCASLVHAVGLGQLVCDSRRAYEDRAVELGTRPDMLAALRDRLRVGRDSCTLFDMPRLVMGVESLYKQMWNEYLSGQVSEPDLRNLDIYDEIGNASDTAMEDVSDLRIYEQKYATEIAYQDRISPVPIDRRLWTGLSH